MTGMGTTLREVVETAERQAIDGALRQTNGHVTDAAVLLGVSRRTLWNRIHALGVIPATYRLAPKPTA